MPCDLIPIPRGRKEGRKVGRLPCVRESKADFGCCLVLGKPIGSSQGCFFFRGHPKVVWTEDLNDTAHSAHHAAAPHGCCCFELVGLTEAASMDRAGPLFDLLLGPLERRKMGVQPAALDCTSPSSKPTSPQVALEVRCRSRNTKNRRLKNTCISDFFKTQNIRIRS